MVFAIARDHIDPQPLIVAMKDPSAGALATFEGWVRNHHQGRDVTLLEYEVYDDLACREGSKILQEAVDGFNLLQARCLHRAGRLHPGDLAVWVGVTAGHRREALRACEFVIEQVKKRLPIWKKEHYHNGNSGWVNLEPTVAATDRSDQP